MATETKLSGSWNSSTNQKGEFVRKASTFRNFVKADPNSQFPAEANRYHLYVSLACPWANRALIVRKLKGLEDLITVDIVEPILETGWKFNDSVDKCTVDTVNGKTYLREIYLMCDPEYTGNFTVPLLFDKKTKTIVNNESSDIIRIFNSEFNNLIQDPKKRELDLYPVALREKIDEINDWVYKTINNGVYKCGFAKTQEAYDEAFDILFEHMDKVEDILSRNRYLCGSQFTEADVRLFVSLIRFDAVYVLHFKTNKKRVIDYPNIYAYTREIYQMDHVKDVIDFNHIKTHYMLSHKHINPSGIIARGPILDFDSPHNREHLSSSS